MGLKPTHTTLMPTTTCLDVEGFNFSSQLVHGILRTTCSQLSLEQHFSCSDLHWKTLSCSLIVVFGPHLATRLNLAHEICPLTSVRHVEDLQDILLSHMQDIKDGEGLKDH